MACPPCAQCFYRVDGTRAPCTWPQSLSRASVVPVRVRCKRKVRREEVKTHPYKCTLHASQPHALLGLSDIAAIVTRYSGSDVREGLSPLSIARSLVGRSAETALQEQVARRWVAERSALLYSSGKAPDIVRARDALPPATSAPRQPGAGMPALLA